MPIFVSTTFAALNSSAIETVGLLKDHRINNIELGSIHRSENGLLSALKNSGGNFLTHSFFPPQEDRFIINIASRDRLIRKKSISFIKKAIDFSIEINAALHTIHPGFLAEAEKESDSCQNYDFIFKDKPAENTDDLYLESFRIFKESLDELSGYINSKPVKLAVETQGSVSKNELMLFSRPEDFTLFIEEAASDKIGVNLNLGHLNLASKAHGFKKEEAIDILGPKIFAAEVSHNDGNQDQHLSLRADAWYMDMLKKPYFKDIPIIFEGRNILIDDVINSYNLLKKINVPTL